MMRMTKIALVAVAVIAVLALIGIAATLGDNHAPASSSSPTETDESEECHQIFEVTEENTIYQTYGPDPISSISLVSQENCDHMVLAGKAQPPDDGSIYVYIFENGSAHGNRISDIRSGLAVSDGDRVEYVQITEGRRSLLRAGEITESGIVWSNRSLKDVERDSINSELSEASVSLQKLDNESQRYRVVTDGFPTEGRLVAHSFWPSHCYKYSHFKEIENGSIVGSDLLTFGKSIIKVYFETGDERFYIDRFPKENIESNKTECGVSDESSTK